MSKHPKREIIENLNLVESGLPCTYYTTASSPASSIGTFMSPTILDLKDSFNCSNVVFPFGAFLRCLDFEVWSESTSEEGSGIIPIKVGCYTEMLGRTE